MSSRPQVGKRVPDLVVIADREKKHTRYEFRVQCEIELKDSKEAKEVFDLLYGDARANIDSAHRVIRRKFSDEHSTRFKDIVDLAFRDNGSNEPARSDVEDEK